MAWHIERFEFPTLGSKDDQQLSPTVVLHRPNCPGCCEGNICRGGTADDQCGSGGIACFDCTTSDRDCVGGTSCQCIQNGQCGGCCEGNTCHDPVTDEFCGKDGSACDDCTDGSPIESCNSGLGQCQ